METEARSEVATEMVHSLIIIVICNKLISEFEQSVKQDSSNLVDKLKQHAPRGVEDLDPSH